ncbi:MAG: class I SAM-dependent methyltransferase [Prevotellaceae bacterium]|jgi:SAM-dependent methyltransferase|nr:class I SAM-dependent methyltransferase [Prevotellaceae bacterium]
MNYYNDRFYLNQSNGSYNSAKVVLEKTLKMLPKIDSAVDFGCGIGTWLAALQEIGVKEIKGYDGSWVDRKMLMIPTECFTEVDLNKEIFVGKKYDLAISVEVAEHLYPNSAELFIKSLVKSADVILFSAAIPFQGGTNHINEQWPEYWNKIFNKNGYIAMDLLREQIWNETTIEWWYRQNIMLFVKQKVVHMIKKVSPPRSLVCPELYLDKINDLNKADINKLSLWKVYKIALKHMLKKILGKEICDMIKKIKGKKNGT